VSGGENLFAAWKVSVRLDGMITTKREELRVENADLQVVSQTKLKPIRAAFAVTTLY